MDILIGAGLLIISYLIGAIPFGYIIVKSRTGKDIRQVASGRTGGTNAFRAAGIWAGFATAILDLLKTATCVWLVKYLQPDNVWLQVFAPIAGIIGHNYSIFIPERDEKGRLRFRGGAGGAPCAGGSFGLWWPSLLIITPIAGLILYFVGYASIATLSAAFLAIIIFAYRAWIGASPWEYILYGFLSGLVLVWALRPNLSRLIAGQERMIGWRAKRRKLSAQDHPS